MTRKSPAASTRKRKVDPEVLEQELPPDDDWQLSKAQLRELRRRIRDLEDPRRWVLASELLPTFILYYNVSDDTFAMNELTAATLFKRRAAALAVKALLREGIRVVECRKMKSGTVRRVTPVQPRVKPARRKRAEGPQG